MSAAEALQWKTQVPDIVRPHALFEELLTVWDYRRGGGHEEAFKTLCLDVAKKRQDLNKKLGRHPRGAMFGLPISLHTKL